MIARELVGTARAPGGEELRLFRHDRDFMIVLDRNELMSTRMRGSEEALATMTLERLSAPAPRLLVGGYGMGFTLRAALAAHPRARVTVHERNRRLYSFAGLRAAKAALAPGGVLAIWSAARDPAFTRRLEKAGFAVEEVEVRARPNNKGPRHTIWFARVA